MMTWSYRGEKRSVNWRKILSRRQSGRVYNERDNSHCRLIKRAMRIAFAISASECEIDRDTMERQIASWCGLTFRIPIPHPPPSSLPLFASLLVAICVVQWSALVLTALQSLAFALSAAPLRQWETRLRDMNEWILPSPGYIPPRAGSAASTPFPHVPRPYLIPGENIVSH